MDYLDSLVLVDRKVRLVLLDVMDWIVDRPKESKENLVCLDSLDWMVLLVQRVTVVMMVCLVYLDKRELKAVLTELVQKEIRVILDYQASVVNQG